MKTIPPAGSRTIRLPLSSVLPQQSFSVRGIDGRLSLAVPIDGEQRPLTLTVNGERHRLCLHECGSLVWVPCRESVLVHNATALIV